MANSGTHPNNGEVVIAGKSYKGLHELHNVSEKTKLTREWLVPYANYIVQSCNRVSKYKLQKAYDIRHGYRNREEFLHITNKYGVEFPAKLSHIPLIDKHIEVLLGQDYATPLNYRVSCKDRLSINDIRQEKIKSQIDAVRAKVEMKIDAITRGDKQKAKDALSEKAIKDLQRYYQQDWQSNLEIEAQSLLDYFMNTLPLKTTFNTMLEDMLVSGYMYYQCKPFRKGEKPLFREINPIGLYNSKPSHVKFVNKSDRVVYKEYMLIPDILVKYGDSMEKEERERLEQRYQSVDKTLELVDMRAMSLYAEENNLSENQFNSLFTNNYIEVSYAEWKSPNDIGKLKSDENEKFLEYASKDNKSVSRFRNDRYSCVRIGEDIFVDYGRDTAVDRDLDDPYDVNLTINGTAYRDRNGEPFSLCLATKDLGDKYDILHFYWENAVALSGNKAVYIPIENIPIEFGNTPADRIISMLSYMKQGIIPLSITQDGSRDFNHYGQAVNMALDGSVNVIIDMLRFVEETAANITGVSRQSQGNIAQQDGKGTTEFAINQSALVTQHIFSLHKEIVKQALSDLLNAAKFCYPEGFTTSYMSGEKIKTLSLTGIHPLRNYAVFLSDSGEEVKQIDYLKSLAPQMIQGQLLDSESVIDIVTVRSLTELKYKLKTALAEKKEDKIMELTQQLEEAGKQMEKLSKEIESYKKRNMDIEEKKLKIEEHKINSEEEIKEKEMNLKKDIEDKKLELEKQRVELEKIQLQYGSGNQQEITNN